MNNRRDENKLNKLLEEDLKFKDKILFRRRFGR